VHRPVRSKGRLPQTGLASRGHRSDESGAWPIAASFFSPSSTAPIAQTLVNPPPRSVGHAPDPATGPVTTAHFPVVSSISASLKAVENPGVLKASSHGERSASWPAPAAFLENSPRTRPNEAARNFRPFLIEVRAIRLSPARQPILLNAGVAHVEQHPVRLLMFLLVSLPTADTTG